MADTKLWLVTGGTGFIGKALCKALLNKGHEVMVLTRSPSKAQKHMPDGIKFIESLTNVTDDTPINCIVNLAGEPLFGGIWTKKRKQAFFDSRIGTTNALVTLVARLNHKPNVVISGSAIGYYGMSETREFVEDSPAGNDEMADLCIAWENAAKPMSSEITRLAFLRTGLVLDPAGGMLEPLVLSSKLGMGAKLGDGKQWMSWIGLSDIVRLIMYIADNKKISGPVNGTAPKPVQQEYFSDALAAHLNRPRFLKIPGGPLRFILGDMADLLLNGQKVLPQAALNAGFDFKQTTLKQAFA